MIDPRTVMVAIPCYDGKIMAELAGALVMGARLYGALSLPTECSHISLARNLIAAQFMASNFEWLVCIDSDTVPSVGDLELLLQPCDTSVVDMVPSRVVTAQCIANRPIDEKVMKAADMLVCAEYSFKNDTLEPVKLGMGFVRIHRSVFEKLQELRHDGGPTIEVRRDLLERIEFFVADIEDDEDRRVRADELYSLVTHLTQSKEDKAGLGRLWQVSWKGRMYYDYFPSGPLISQFVPTTQWKGEDHGFFTLCMLAGIIPRIETRTRLIHIGRKGYPYLGPQSGGGQ